VAGGARGNTVARCLRDNVTRRLWRRNVGAVSAIMFTIVTGLAAFEGYHRMIHRRAGKAYAGIFMAIVTIDFGAGINNRNMGAIRVIGYIHYAGCTCGMAAASLTAARYAGVVEARGIGKGSGGMARTAVRARHDMGCRLAGGSEDGTVMTVRARLSGHFGSAVIEGAPSKRCRSWRIADVAGRTVARGRYMVMGLPCRIHAIVTGRAGVGQCVIYTPHIQCRMVEGRGKTASGFMTILAYS